MRAGDMLPFSITPYYMSLISRDDPRQPLRRTVVPTAHELVRSHGEADDPLGEEHDSPVPGLVHRYPDRVLLLVLDSCSSYCRYCTRSRVVGQGEIVPNQERLELALDYIRRTPANPRRAPVRRRPALPERTAARLAADAIAGHPARGVHPPGHQNARRAAPTHHPRTVPHVAETPSLVDEPAFHPSRRMHPGNLPGVHSAGRCGHSPGLADGVAARASTTTSRP